MDQIINEMYYYKNQFEQVQKDLEYQMKKEQQRNEPKSTLNSIKDLKDQIITQNSARKTSGRKSSGIGKGILKNGKNNN